MEDKNHKEHSIPEFGINLQYPSWWKYDLEENNTYLFWEEYIGSFRITPFHITQQNFNHTEYLEHEFIEYNNQNLTPNWKTYNNLKYIYYEAYSSIDNSIIHFYLTATPKLVLLCSFSYGKEILEEENSKAALNEAFEEVEKIFYGLIISN